MKTIKLLLLAILTSAIFTASGQCGQVTSGGVAKGPNGSVAYSVGQPLILINESSTNGSSLCGGNQQPPASCSSGVPTSIKMVTISGFEIYPVPATDYVTVKYMDALGSVSLRIFSTEGRIISEQHNVPSGTAIPLQNLSKGVYLLQVSDKSSVVNTKLVRQ